MATTPPEQTEGETFNLRQIFQDVPDQQQTHSEDTPDEDTPQNILRRAIDVPHRDYIPPLAGRSLTAEERKILELEIKLKAARKINASIYQQLNQPGPNPFTYTRIPLQDKGKQPDRNPDGPSGSGGDPGNPGPPGSGGPGGPGGNPPNPPAPRRIPLAQRPDPPSHRSPKIALPAFFTGANSEVHTFIKDCSIYMRVKSDLFQDNDSRIAFILSYCRGPAINDWTIMINEHIESGSYLAPNDHRELLELIRKQFGDVDEEVTAQQEIEKIKQGTDTVEKYVVKFRMLQYRTGYDQKALIAIFRRGIHDKLLDRIYNMVDMPTSLEQWFEMAIRFDSQYRERRDLGKNSPWRGTSTSQRPNRPSYQRPSGPPPNAPSHNPPTNDRRDQTGTTYGGTGQAMDMGRATGGRNCYYCGIAGHMARNCRQKQFGCRNCGSKEHAANKCPNPRRDTRVREVIMDDAMSVLEEEQSGKEESQ